MQTTGNKVFISRIIPAIGVQLLQEAGCHITQFTEKRNLSPEELVSFCRENDALLSAGPNQVNEDFLRQCPHLKVVALLSVGHDNVDTKAATRYKIPIGNTPGVLSRATADIAFLLMLAVSRKAFFMNQTIRDGGWGFNDPTANLGIELAGKTLGVVGLGKIGIEMAKKCRAAYGMDIIYHNRRRNAEAEAETGATYVSFDELLQQSDVVSVHANLSEDTKGMFDQSAFGKMKPTAIFINTGRGGLHNEAHLIAALQQGVIWGAGLDVTNPEPMAKDNPLLSMPTVCVLPHIGSATQETRDAMATLAAQNIIAGLQGKRLPHVVNPEVYG